MSSSPRSNVLSERSTNIPQSPEKSKNGFKNDGKLQQEAQPKSLEYHRQEFEARLKENKSVNTTSTTISTITTVKKTISQPRSITNSSDTASFGSNTTPLISSHGSEIMHQAHKVRSLSRNQQTYVSPSDNIQSPATAKLAAFKNRHIKR
jgi:hypothetical protein